MRCGASEGSVSQIKISSIKCNGCLCGVATHSQILHAGSTHPLSLSHLRAKRVRTAFSHFADWGLMLRADNDNERGSLAANRPCFNHRPRLNWSVPRRACAPKMRPSKLITGDIPCTYSLVLWRKTRQNEQKREERDPQRSPIISHSRQ
jgi:hypothetical protein